MVKIVSNILLAELSNHGRNLALVRAYGIESQVFIDLLTQTLYPSPVFEAYGEMIAQERYSPAGFKQSLGLKDFRLALEAGEAQPLALLLGSTGILKPLHKVMACWIAPRSAKQQRVAATSA